MTRKTYSPPIIMDKSTALSFTIPNTVPAPVYPHNGTKDALFMSGVNDASPARTQGTYCCPMCKLQFKEYASLLAHKHSCGATTTSSPSSQVPLPDNNTSVGAATAKQWWPAATNLCRVLSASSRATAHGASS